MKKILLLISVITVALSSCKKGEEDPFISLRSRDARITGTWKLTKMDNTYNSTYTYPGSGISSNSNSSSFDGTVLTNSNSSTGPGGSSSSTTVSEYSFELTIEKGGISSSKTTQKITTSNGTPVTNSTPTSSENSGEWFWLDNDKKKTYIIVSNISGNVLRLTNKELIIKAESKNSSANGDPMNPSTSSMVSTEYYVFEKIK